MELLRLSALVITSLVSISAQDCYEPTNDFYDDETGYLNGVSFPPTEYNVDGNNEDNYEAYPPMYYVGKNTNDYLTSRDSNGNYQQLKKQHQHKKDPKEIKKLMTSVKKMLPPLVQLLQYDGVEENNGNSGYSRRHG